VKKLRAVSKKATLGAILIGISLGLYLTSLTMVVAQVNRTVAIFGVGQTESTPYSLLKTIRDLYTDGEYGLALIITAFTLIFPIGKYIALAYIYLGSSARWRSRLLLWVKNLGQWSMGDVFVVAMMVVIIRINGSVAEISVEPLAGLWVFALSVLLSMICSSLLGFDRNRESG
jgi:paraquat-inducible protein A